MAIDDDEQAAIARLQQGDIGGLETLVRRYHARAVRGAYLVVHDHALALDVTQSAFVRAYECIGQFDARRPFGPWFFTLLLRGARRAAARQARTGSLESDDGRRLVGSEARLGVDMALGPEQLWEQRELAQAVIAALAELPAGERAAIVQRYYFGLTESEMAAASGSPRGTIKWRLHSARLRLRPLLQPFRSESEVLK